MRAALEQLVSAKKAQGTVRQLSLPRATRPLRRTAAWVPQSLRSMRRKSAPTVTHRGARVRDGMCFDPSRTERGRASFPKGFDMTETRVHRCAVRRKRMDESLGVPIQNVSESPVDGSVKP